MGAPRVPEPPLVLRSPAKVNLWLDVEGRRADGYHGVDTLLLALDRCDTLTARLDGEGGVRLSLSGPAATDDVPRGDENLAVRGARVALALARERGRGPAGAGLELGLEKTVPSQAGLGGGSSNAAAACLAAAALLGLEADAPGLAQGLARLGSDCPFFALARASGLARCGGRGERVEPLALPASGRAVLVVTPRVACATRAVYAAWRPGDRGRAAFPDPDLWFRGPLGAAREALRNDLEPAALRSHPGLRAWRDRLDAAGGAHFRLAGSGSSFFGLFEDAAAAAAFLEERLAAGKGRDHGLRAAFVARPAGALAGP